MSRFLLLVLLATVAGCGSDATTPSAPEEAFQLPADQVMIGGRHSITNEGVRAATLHSDSVLVYEESRQFTLMGVRLQFFTEQGVESGTLTSRRGEYNPSSGLFVAREDVVLVTEGPQGERRLETEELLYEIRREQLSTDFPFTMTEAGRTSRGTSFRSDTQFRQWEVTGVQTEGTVRGEGGITF
jgi:LPS export ABC transporter protein LptC